MAEGDGAFLRDLAAFGSRGRRTERFVEDGLTYFVNDFWTSRQRRSHRIHEISYRACFKAELPAFFIERLTRRGDVVYDPFMGRGTTPLQAALMGRRAVGNDVNPLSAMLARPRLRPPTLPAVANRLAAIPDGGAPARDDELLAFYHPDTLGRILALRRWLLDRERDEPLDPVDDWIRLVALSRLTGHSSGFFSVYSLPPNQAVSVRGQRRINERRGQIPPRRDVDRLILRKSRSLLSQGAPEMAFPARFGAERAEFAAFVADASVDLVVTSPPFLDVVQYATDNWLRCWFAGIDPAAVRISSHGNPEAWTRFVRASFIDLARVVRAGGRVAFEVGEVRNGRLLLERLVRDAVAGLPFELLGVVVNDQSFTKTSNCWGVANNRRGTNTNRIVMLRRR